MGIINRTKDPSEQKEAFDVTLRGIVTAATYQVCVVPYPANVEAIVHSHQGLSGSPALRFDVWRFIAGAGFTSVVTGLGASATIVALATSGVLSASLPAVGSTLLQVQAKDVITLHSFAANTATVESHVQVVLKKTQDKVSYYGDAE